MSGRVQAAVRRIAAAVTSRSGVTLACLALAIACYAIGWRAGAIGAIAIGVVFEGAFSVRLLRAPALPRIQGPADW